MVTQYRKQDIVDMLRKVGLTEQADEAMRVLPDPVDADEVARFGALYGITRDTLISRMGGSP